MISCSMIKFRIDHGVKALNISSPHKIVKLSTLFSCSKSLSVLIKFTLMMRWCPEGIILRCVRNEGRKNEWYDIVNMVIEMKI